MNFLNTKNVRIAALVTASINLLFALMTFVMISTMFSIASVASIIHWISMVFGIIILGYVLYSAFGLKQALSSSGKVFAVAQTIAVFLGVVWIAGLYGAMAATGSFISGLGGFLEYSTFDLIKKLLFYMGGGLGSVIFIFIIYMIANIVCILIAVKFNIFLVGADGVTPKRVKVEKLKLTDAEGKVIYLTKGEAAGMDLSNYTVETIEEDAVASEPVVDLSGAASTASSMVSSVAGVAGDVSSKAGSFLKTPKGKKTAIGGVIAVLLVVLGIIFIPKLFLKL